MNSGKSINKFEKCTIVYYYRVMMGAFPLIIPNDPVMKMKIEEKALSLIKNENPTEK